MPIYLRAATNLQRLDAGLSNVDNPRKIAAFAAVVRRQNGSLPARMRSRFSAFFPECFSPNRAPNPK